MGKHTVQACQEVKIKIMAIQTDSVSIVSEILVNKTHYLPEVGSSVAYHPFYQAPVRYYFTIIVYI